MKTKEKLINFKEKLLNIFFPSHIKCVFCGEELNEHAVYDTCSHCQQTLPFITRPCLRCGEQMPDSYSNVCYACNKNNRYFTQAKSVFEYTNNVYAIVHKFKYSNKKYLAEPISKYMSELLATWNISPDIICDVPIHEKKLKKKKYNHSTLLAQKISEYFGIPYLPLCTKIINNPSQTELERNQRKENVKDAYTINPTYKKDIKDKTILIIDDVITTCATIDEISKTLLNAGAKEVYAFSFAHTPPPKEETKKKPNKQKT